MSFKFSPHSSHTRLHNNPSAHLYFPSHKKVVQLQDSIDEDHLTARSSTPSSPSNRKIAPIMSTLGGLLKRSNPHLGSSSLCSSSQGSSDHDSFDSDPGFPPKKTVTSSLSHPPLQSSSQTMNRRGRLPSFNRSYESTDSSNSSSNTSDLSAGKANYRIMILGAKTTGKTSIVRQFLYDQFSTVHKETVDDMYRGEFDICHQTVGFDIQDVSGGYVYEFPGMRNVSLASADAFIIVYAVNDPESWEEVSRLRDMIHEAKDEEVPIVVVANKCDLDKDPSLSCETIEATVIFDWENGYVQSSAKDRVNINKIFKELMNQAKTKYDFTVPQISSASVLLSAQSARGCSPAIHKRGFEDNLRRRQSVPAVPAGFNLQSTITNEGGEGCSASSSGSGHQGPLATLMSKMQTHSRNHEPVGPVLPGPAGYPELPKVETPKAKNKRRSSLAALRRDSCKIS
ncbi:hypothetical protein TCAL_04096 [Tigriopus californicus]|uniref:GTP-binding protein Rhes n=1 Tax=Tigriopus californicus TaxID=6832 RepID=A0A553NUB5_TIGCA|nr:uncharacterized protein LOC131881149 [Tigriopus californicus]XP_059083919.1 uncharacterized protein LOC131881149 [Tigriopus californicus]TRY69006.1 hypothetical protein TCAL_04096 [Tigriopus californicus]